MKRIVLLFLLFSLCIYSQNKNFSIEDNLIYWKFVYEDTTNVLELRNHPRLDFKTDSTGVLKKGTDKERNLSPYSADFKIEKKPGKYRISVFNIVSFNDNPTSLNINGVIIPEATQITIEEKLINSSGKIKKRVWGVDLSEIINADLTEIFTIKKRPKSEW